MQCRRKHDTPLFPHPPLGLQHNTVQASSTQGGCCPCHSPGTSGSIYPGPVILHILRVILAGHILEKRRGNGATLTGKRTIRVNS